MDEADLLGEDCSDLEGPVISQEEEDALLGELDVPMQSASIANPAVATIPSSANEDMPEETAEKEKTDELAEEIPEKDGNAGLSATNSESSNDAPSPTIDLRENSFLRSALRLQKKSMDRENARLNSLLNVQMNKMLNLGDAQRSDSRKINEIRRSHQMVSSNVQILKDGFVALATKFRMPVPQTLVHSSVVKAEFQRTEDLAYLNGSSTHQDGLKRRPAVHSTRLSNAAFYGDEASTSQQLGANKKRRLYGMDCETGSPSSDMSSPSSSSPASGRQPPQISLSRPIKQHLATGAARVQSMPDPLPRPGPLQASVASGIPRTNSATTMKAPTVAHQHNGSRMNQHHLQQTSHNATVTPNGVVARAFTDYANMTAQQRKNALEYMNSQLPPHNQIGPNRALIMADEKIAYLQQLGNVIPNGDGTITGWHKRILQADNVAVELDKFDAEPPRALTFCERIMLTRFVLPLASDVRKIAVNHPYVSTSRPSQRPNKELPINTELLVDDMFVPKIELRTTREGFNDTARLDGRIRFTASRDWPENIARICLFYFIGTENPGSWKISDFATVELKRENEQDNYKEVVVRFAIQLDKQSYSENKHIWKHEMVGIVACACAEGGTQIRGDEVVFDYETEVIRHKRSQIQSFDPAWKRFVAHYEPMSKKRQGATNAAADDDDDIQAL